MTRYNDTTAYCCPSDVGGRGGGQVAPFLTSPRVSWHICDDAGGRTTVAEDEGKDSSGMRGIATAARRLCMRDTAGVH